MKWALFFGLFIIVAVVVGCEAEEKTKPVIQVQPPSPVQPAIPPSDDQLIQQYPDDLDTALEELNQLEK